MDLLGIYNTKKKRELSECLAINFPFYSPVRVFQHPIDICHDNDPPPMGTITTDTAYLSL